MFICFIMTSKKHSRESRGDAVPNVMQYGNDLLVSVVFGFREQSLALFYLAYIEQVLIWPF